MEAICLCNEAICIRCFLNILSRYGANLTYEPDEDYQNTTIHEKVKDCTTNHDLLLGLEKLREMITTG